MSSAGLGLSKSLSPVEVVRRFCAEWPGLPPGEIGSLFTDDCVYQHMSVNRPLVGPRAIAGAIEIFRARFEQIESEVTRIAEGDGFVLCERDDRFWLPGGRIVGFHAMASFETREGRIALFHDYYDLAALERQVDLSEG